MEKKIVLFLCLLILGGKIWAQDFPLSYKYDYITHLYKYCPDSLREDLAFMNTPNSDYVFKSFETLPQLDALLRYEQKPSVVLRCKRDEMLVYVYGNPEIKDFYFDFFYINPKGRVACFRLLNTLGHLSRSFRTRNGTVYCVFHEWGFLEISENYSSLLNCHCQVIGEGKNVCDFKIEPFLGTKPHIWTKLENGDFIWAFF